MKKIIVCLPSYNESKNIRFITKKVDKSLCRLGENYNCIILNTDNNSPDKTNEIFNNTKTVNKKVSIVTGKKGKGENIINFMKYCYKENADYAIMLDTDLKSLGLSWIPKMVTELQNGQDFIFPLYKRTRYEGNTTNHFVILILYALYGIKIRQPIGGDYAFNKQYIRLFMQQDLNKEIKKYGIDIYMAMLNVKYKLKYSQLKLGKKRHAPSYNKMDKIFIEVANSICQVVKNIDIKKVGNDQNDINGYVSISRKKYCNYMSRAIKDNQVRFYRIGYSIV